LRGLFLESLAASMVGPQSGWSRDISSSYPAVPETVGALRDEIAELAAGAGATGERLQAVRLAVSEAATNAILHAYRGAPGEIHLTASVLDGELTVLLADDGCGLAEPAVTPGLGWGWKLIADACDALTIAQRSVGGVEMRMCFQLATEQNGGAAEASMPQIVERAVAREQRVARDVRGDRYARGKREELLAVAPGEVGD
jgi:anti-sigma regulatory factor (Ser/Thr protein kinase)